MAFRASRRACCSAAADHRGPAYGELVKRYAKGSSLRALTEAPGAPRRKEDCFSDLSRLGRRVLSDSETAFFLQKILDEVVSGTAKHLDGVARCLALLEAAEGAWHDVRAKSYTVIMRVCWEADRDDTRRLLLDLFHRFVEKERAFNALSAALTPDICSMAIRANLRIANPVYHLTSIRRESGTDEPENSGRDRLDGPNQGSTSEVNSSSRDRLDGPDQGSTSEVDSSGREDRNGAEWKNEEEKAADMAELADESLGGPTQRKEQKKAAELSSSEKDSKIPDSQANDNSKKQHGLDNEEFIDEQPKEKPSEELGADTTIHNESCGEEHTDSEEKTLHGAGTRTQNALANEEFISGRPKEKPLEELRVLTTTQNGSCGEEHAGSEEELPNGASEEKPLHGGGTTTQNALTNDPEYAARSAWIEGAHQQLGTAPDHRVDESRAGLALKEGTAELQQLLRVSLAHLPGMKSSSQQQAKVPKLYASIFAGYTRLHHATQDPATRAPTVYSSKARALYTEALATRSVTEASLYELIAVCGSFNTALNMIKDGHQLGIPPSVKLYNAMLLSLVHRDVPAVQPRSQSSLAFQIREVLQLFKDATLEPDNQTLGLVVAVYRKHAMGHLAASAMKQLRSAYPALIPPRSALTSLIAAQVPLCARPDFRDEHLRIAEECLVEIFERGLLRAPPVNTADQPLLRLMQCYAAAGELKKLEVLRDSFFARVRSGEFHATIRVTPAMRTAYTDCHRAAAHNALRAAKVDWGGPLHFPWNSPEPCPDSLPDSYP